MRAWELPNYELDGAQVDPILSRRVRVGPPADQFAIRRLAGVADLTGRLGPRMFGALELVGGSPEYLFGLEGLLRDYDVAHGLELNYPFTHQAVRARGAGRLRRVVATVMENIPLKPHPNALVAARAREVASQVDMFVAITERARLHLCLAGVPDERITVLPLGTDVERFRPAVGRRRPGPIRLLSVARLEPAKGVEDVVIAAGLLAQRGHELELSFVGAGPLEARLWEIATSMGVEHRLHVLARPWTELPELYRDHDIFVLASAATRWWREQFGFAAVEAMASGLPVLVGDSGSLPEVVGRPETLIRPHDPLSLTDALERLTDADVRRREGEISRERALERFDQRKIRAQLRAVYDKVLDEPAA